MGGHYHHGGTQQNDQGDQVYSWLQERQQIQKIMWSGWHVASVEWGEKRWWKLRVFYSWGQMKGLPVTPHRDGNGSNVNGSWNRGMRRYQQMGDSGMRRITSGDSVGCRLSEIWGSTGDMRVGETCEKKGWHRRLSGICVTCPFSGLGGICLCPPVVNNSCFCPALHFSFCVVFLPFINFILNYFLVAKCLLYIL